MKLSVSLPIKAKKEDVWRTIAKIDSSSDIVSGIEKIEVLERPSEGLVGLKWRETRTMFGKEATEVMTITEAVENEYYETYAENHGAIYRSRMSVSGENDESVLTMSFNGEPQTFGAKVMSFLMGALFKGSTRKMMQKDLEDIKSHVEK